MSTYDELIKKNSNALEVYCYHIINDKTLQESYSIYTNLHADFGILSESLKHYHGTSKRKFRSISAKFKKMTGKRYKLSETCNSLGYTRLVYKLI